MHVSSHNALSNTLPSSGHDAHMLIQCERLKPDTDPTFLHCAIHHFIIMPGVGEPVAVHMRTTAPWHKRSDEAYTVPVLHMFEIDPPSEGAEWWRTWHWIVSILTRIWKALFWTQRRVSDLEGNRVADLEQLQTAQARLDTLQALVFVQREELEFTKRRAAIVEHELAVFTVRVDNYHNDHNNPQAFWNWADIPNSQHLTSNMGCGV